MESTKNAMATYFVYLAKTAPEERERPSLPIISPPAMAPERPLPLDS